MDAPIPISILWSFFRKWLPNYYLKKKFSPEILSQLIYVDIRPRHESVSINLSSSGSYQIWLQVINLSPFDIELDRSEFNFCCGARLKCRTVLRKKIKSGETSVIFLEDTISDGQAGEIALNASNNTCLLDGYMEFNCVLHPILKHLSLDGIKPRYINLQSRSLG